MTSIPNYIPKVVAALRQSGLTGRGQVAHAYVAHDDWCALLSGRGPCNCNPDVRVTGKPLAIPGPLCHADERTASGSTAGTCGRSSASVGHEHKGR